MFWACDKEASRWFQRSPDIQVFQVRPHLECMDSLSSPSQVLVMVVSQGAGFSMSLRDGPTLYPCTDTALSTHTCQPSLCQPLWFELGPFAEPLPLPGRWNVPR